MERSGLYTLRKGERLYKSYSSLEKKIEISYYYIGEKKKETEKNKDLYYEEIIFNNQTYYINFNKKILLNNLKQQINYIF